MRPVRISYAFIILTLVLAASLQLTTPLITVLFSYFALERLNFGRKKGIAIVLFLILVLGIIYGFAFFLKQALVAFPHIASTTIPSVIEFAKKHDVQLPFTDLDTLKNVAVDTVVTQIKGLSNIAKGTGKQIVLLVIGLVVAISVFVNSRLMLDESKPSRNLYTAICDEITARFRTFYDSFAVVMGAQIVISGINTLLTSVFVIAVSLPYSGVIVALTFLCGLLPIIGNLLSNIVIVGISFTISPKMAAMALVFLVVLHKLEYFLNSKIIGDRIKNPIWLTLLGLVLGERLMGIPGMILAPVVLYWIKVETSRLSAHPAPAPTLPAPSPLLVPPGLVPGPAAEEAARLQDTERSAASQG